MKKKHIVIIFLSLIFLVFLQSGLCEKMDEASYIGWELHYIPQRQISIAIPNGCEVLTQSTRVSSIFDEKSLKSAIEQMKSQDIYLDAISPDYRFEIVVNAKDNIIKSFEDFNDPELNLVLTKYKQTCESQDGVKVQHIEFVDIQGIKYIKVKIKFDRGTEKSFSVQYVTFMDYQHVAIGLNKSFEEIGETEEELLEEIIKRSNVKKH